MSVSLFVELGKRRKYVNETAVVIVSGGAGEGEGGGGPREQGCSVGHADQTVKS